MAEIDLSTKYIKETMPSVEGWFYEPDIVCFLAINHVQKARGVAGAIVEVGVFRGKSLGLLATFRAPDERTYGFDLYTGRASLDVTRDVLQKAVGNLNGIELIPANTGQLSQARLRSLIRQPVRFLHVDGGHDYDEALSDLTKFGALVDGEGAIAVDDYYDRDFPGVCAATNDFIRQSGFVPFLAGQLKLYLCRPEQVKNYLDGLLRIQQFQSNARLDNFMWQPMLIPFTAKPHPHEEIVKEVSRQTLDWRFRA